MAAGTAQATTPPPSAAAAVTSVVINEIESSTSRRDANGEYIELANTDTSQAVDISGWTLRDDDPTHEAQTIPAGTTIEAGGYQTIFVTAFGLSAEDTVTVRNAAGEIVATASWTEHPQGTLSRCPDMTGEFSETETGSPGLSNGCGWVSPWVVEAEPWPFGNTVVDAAAADTWEGDQSGLDFAPDGTLYAVNDQNGEIFKMRSGGDTFTIDQSWVPTYPDGTGRPDAEGITIDGEGTVFLSTERNNDANTVSRPSVLRVETDPDGSVRTTHEWNLTALTGELRAIRGIEAIEWISDEDATRLGLMGANGVYQPGDFGAHYDGVFVVAVEQTTEIMIVVLEEDGTSTLLQKIAEAPETPIVMALDWHAGGNELWAQCDEDCANRSTKLAFVDGVLTAQEEYAAPTGMNRNFSNEGLAIEWCDIPGVTPSVFWISDTAHDDVSLRAAFGGACAGAGDPPSGEPSGPPVQTGAGEADSGTTPWVALSLMGLLGVGGAGLVLRRRES